MMRKILGLCLAVVLAPGGSFRETGVRTPTDPQWKTTFDDISTAASLQTPW